MLTRHSSHPHIRICKPAIDNVRRPSKPCAATLPGSTIFRGHTRVSMNLLCQLEQLGVDSPDELAKIEDFVMHRLRQIAEARHLEQCRHAVVARWPRPVA